MYKLIEDVCSFFFPQAALLLENFVCIQVNTIEKTLALYCRKKNTKTGTHTLCYVQTAKKKKIKHTGFPLKIQQQNYGIVNNKLSFSHAPSFFPPNSAVFVNGSLLCCCQTWEKTKQNQFFLFSQSNQLFLMHVRHMHTHKCTPNNGQNTGGVLL